MSLYVGASYNDYGYKSAGVIDHNSAYTWMAWVDLVSDSNDYGHIWDAGNGAFGSGGDYSNADWVGTGSDGTTLTLGSYVGGSGNDTTASALTVGTPTHITVTRTSSSNLDLYVGGGYAVSVATNVGARGATAWEAIGLLNGIYNAPVRLTAMKQWQAALSADEIKAEMRLIRPQRLSNLHSWHPGIAGDLTTALKDYSGNGRDWTAQGTISVASQTPPVSWGANPVIVLPVISTTSPQYLAPTSDVAAGAWTPSSGSDLYAMLDEAAYSDADYISATSASTCTLALASGTDPVSSTGHVLRYRLLSGSGSVAVALKQGTTTIASWGPHTLTGAAQDFAQTLTAGEADSITNYSALRVEITSST